MPTGVYWAEFSMDPWVVLEAAKRPALPIDSRADIVVSGAGQIVYYPEIAENRLPGLGSYEGQQAVQNPLSALFRAQQPVNPKGGLLGFSLAENADSTKWLESIFDGGVQPKSK